MAVFSIWYNRNFEPYFFTVDLSYLVQNTNNWDKSKCLFTESSIKPGRSDFKCLTLYLYVHIWSFLYCISYTHTFFFVLQELHYVWMFTWSKSPGAPLCVDVYLKKVSRSSTIYGCLPEGSL